MKYTEQQKQIYNEVCDKYKHHWLNTTVSQTMAMEMINKALAISRVVVPKGTLCDKNKNKLGMCNCCGDINCHDDFCKG